MNLYLQKAFSCCRFVSAQKRQKCTLLGVIWVAICFCYKESSIVIIGYVTFFKPWLSFIPHCSVPSVIQSFMQKICKVLESKTMVYFSLTILIVWPQRSDFIRSPSLRNDEQSHVGEMKLRGLFRPIYVRPSFTRHDDTWIVFVLQHVQGLPNIASLAATIWWIFLKRHF